jgi:HEAT repeat protein
VHAANPHPLRDSRGARRGREEAVFRGKTVRQWAAQLTDKNDSVRWYATHALARIGPQAGAAVPALQKVLENRGEHEYVRGGAARALGCIGPAAAPAAALLIETSASEHHVSVRRNLGPAAKPAIEALLMRLEDKDATVRVNAAVALWQIDRHPRAIRALVEMVRRGEGTGAYQATVALGELGTPADAAIPALAEALRSGDEDVSRAAAAALGRMGPVAIPAVRGLLAVRGDAVARRAVEALERFGPAGVPALVEALKAPSPLARSTAARALGRLGPAGHQGRSALLEAVNDKDPQVRETAAWALGQIQPAGKPAGI